MALTHMDEFVRRSMLGYPSLFPDRASVLSHTFLVLGNGIEWEQNGRIQLPRNTAMRYDDLDTRIERLFSDRDYEGDTVLEQFYAEQRAAYEVKIEHERADRKRLEADIEAIACAKLPEDFKYSGDHYESPVEFLRHLRSGYLLMGACPPRVEASCFEGMMEAFEVMLRMAPDPETVEGLLEAKEKLIAKTEIYTIRKLRKTKVFPPPKREKYVRLPDVEKMQISLRAIEGKNCVILNGVYMMAHRDYEIAAAWAKTTFSLSDDRMTAIHADYEARKLT